MTIFDCIYNTHSSTQQRKTWVLLAYLYSPCVWLEAPRRILSGHTALDGRAIDLDFILLQTQLWQAVAFTHPQLSVHQVHTATERKWDTR